MINLGRFAPYAKAVVAFLTATVTFLLQVLPEVDSAIGDGSVSYAELFTVITVVAEIGRAHV